MDSLAHRTPSGLPLDQLVAHALNRPCLRLVVMFPFQILPQGTSTPSDHAHVGRTQPVAGDVLSAALPLPSRP